MTGHRILVVEDTPDLALAVSMELEDAGYIVTLAHTGAEAREEIAREVPELAVLDMQLPDTTGIALCEEIRRSHSIPLIIFSGVNSEKTVLEVIQRGATDYVLKGSGLTELVSRIKHHLDGGQPNAKKPRLEPVPEKRDKSDGRTRILVVESDQAQEAQLVELLAISEYRVIVATSAQEAIELAQSEQPSVVMIALDSAQAGGMKLVQTLKADNTRSPGIVAVSKRLSPEAVRRAKYHGVSAFITRPWNPSRIHLEITHAINAALKASKRAA